SSREALNGLGLALVRAGRVPEGLGVLRRGLTRFPAEAALHKNAALASWMLGDAAGALRDAARALAVAPGYGPALGIRARARARLGDRTGAVQDWNAMIGATPRPEAEETAEVRRDLLADGVPAAALAPPAGSP